MKKKFWNLLKTIAKFLLTGIALYWVFTKINFTEVLGIIGKSRILDMTIAIGLFALSKVIASTRLNLIFKETNIDIDFQPNLKLYWLGMFYNLFLPGGIGGDGYKIYLLNKTKGASVKSAFGAVFVDRLVGVLALTVLVTFIVPFIQQIFPYQKFTFLLTFLLIGGFYLFLRLFYKLYLGIYPTIFVYSLGVQMLQLICAYFILSALGYQDEVFKYLTLFLISSIVAILPLTIGGVGAREFTFLIGANYLALDPEISVALSLSFYLITALVSLVGIIWVIKPIKLD